MDRVLLDTVRGVGKRNDIVDHSLVMKAKSAGIESLKVRSPLTCDSAEGICQKCYGLMPNGSLPNIGENVGVLESSALTERSTQLTMQSFHSGGAASTAKNVSASFPRLQQLIKVPENISGKASLAHMDGTVKKVEPNEIGGWEIFVNDIEHNVSPGRTPIVTVGQEVKKGEPLTDGPIKPQELGEITDHLTAQKYIVNELSDIFGGAFYKKTMETVVRGISDNAIIDEAPDDTGMYRGNKGTLSNFKKINRERSQMGLEPIKYTPYFKSVDTLNVDSEDWLTRVTTNRIKDALQKGMAKMQFGDISGKDPIPAYIYGEDFGQPNKKGNTNGFY